MSLAPMPSQAITLELPEPPSANRWWRHVGGRVLLSREARTYKQAVANRSLVARVPMVAAPDPIAITVTWYRGRRSGDLDKRLGVLLDALQGCLYENDSQIVAIHATRQDDPGKPRVLVTVCPRPTP